MADIVDFNKARQEGANKVLDDAKDCFNSVVVIGWTTEDDLIFLADKSIADPDILWMLKLIEMRILLGEIDYDGDYS